jgi:hypothetical protein
MTLARRDDDLYLIDLLDRLLPEDLNVDLGPLGRLLAPPAE